MTKTRTMWGVVGFRHGIPGSANVGRFQYTGQAWLPELGMYHYKNRIYSPTLGRFLQTDPIGVEGGINLYAYVGNDPVNFTDPLGLFRFLNPAPPECQGGGNWCNRPNNAYMDAGTIVVPYEPTKAATIDFSFYTIVSRSIGGISRGGEDKLNQCEIAFVSKFLKQNGLPTDHLKNVRFHNGMEWRGPIVAAAGWNGNPAITRSNNVYVSSVGDSWSSVRDRSGSTFWSEVVHTAQYAKYGRLFEGMYAYGMLDSYSQGKDGWNGNAMEDHAHRLGEQLSRAWKDYGKDSCQD